MSASWQILTGDCRDVLPTLPAGSVHTVVTSPPYFGLRDYGHDGQLGLEPSPDEFVAALVDVFRLVRRVLRDDGTVWLNLGDSYNNRAVNRPSSHQEGLGFDSEHLSTSWRDHAANGRARMSIQDGDLKEKDLLGIPWMVAFALRADGWYLRSEIIWAKPNPMPESVTDRPTKAHEQVFLLSKRPAYFYDLEAIREPISPTNTGAVSVVERQGGTRFDEDGKPIGVIRRYDEIKGANRRSVWTVATTPYAGAHFATFPPKLIEPCVLAGCPERACGECGAPWVRVVERETRYEGNSARSGRPLDAISEGGKWTTERRNGHANVKAGPVVEFRTLGFEPSCNHDAPTVPGTVLDPFAGAGTTGMVALRHGRSFVGVELSAAYADMARWRIRDDAPLLNAFSEIA